jgi:hypothetical protein
MDKRKEVNAKAQGRKGATLRLCAFALNADTLTPVGKRAR